MLQYDSILCAIIKPYSVLHDPEYSWPSNKSMFHKSDSRIAEERQGRRLAELL